MRLCQVGEQSDLEEIVLFPFDDYAIPFQKGVKVGMNSYRQHVEAGSNVVLEPGGTGAPDSHRVAYYGSVVRVGNELWMWYLGTGHDEDVWYERICHARSRDGKTWTRPDLGLVEYKGNRHNNLVMIADGEHVQSLVVLHEPQDPDSGRRFKMLFQCRKYGGRLAVAFSEDGVRWREHPGNPVGSFLEICGCARIGGDYIVNGQGRPDHWTPKGHARKLVSFVSHDLENWSPASALGHRRDALPPQPTIYGLHNGPQVHLGAALWNRGNTLIGFYGMWNGHPADDRRLTQMDLGLVVSHDGLHFREPRPDFPIVAASELGMPQPHQGYATAHFPALVQGQGFENVGEETLFWYAPWPEQDSDGIRLATWPRDRLGHFQPFVGPGEDCFVISQSVATDGQPFTVALNVRGLSPQAHLTVSILDREFTPLAGYTVDACIAPSDSGFRQLVTWQDHELVVSGSPIRIRVDFGGVRPEDLRLYAVYLNSSG